EEKFLRRSINQLCFRAIHMRPIERPLIGHDKQVEELFGVDEAKHKRHEKSQNRPDQAAAQFDQVLKQRCCALFDFVFVACHALFPVFFVVFLAGAAAEAFAVSDFVAAGFLEAGFAAGAAFLLAAPVSVALLVAFGAVLRTGFLGAAAGFAAGSA